GSAAEGAGTSSLPDALAGPFTDAMAEALLVPALAFLVGLVVAQFLVKPTHDRG
ncbi:MFS transporter, partial [Aeromicrobium tamlense]|nr:MFS transporter [Aeromicrobium tamlense]